jgi:hypothetical protein
MRKRTLAVFVIALTLGLATLLNLSAKIGSNLIVPGQSVGQMRLGRYGAVYLAKLPKPDADDSGMGRYRSVWLSRKQGGQTDTLYVYSVANGPRNIKPFDGASIRLIRVTSPWYRTIDGLFTGSTLSQILHRFPNARPTDPGQTLYDDAKLGIAFEFAGPAPAGSACVAIMIHPPGDVNLATAQDVNEILRANGIQP